MSRSAAMMQTFPGFQKTESCIHREKLEITSTVKYLLSLVGRGKNQPVRGEDFVHPSLQVPRISKLRNRIADNQNGGYIMEELEEVKMMRDWDSKLQMNSNNASSIALAQKAKCSSFNTERVHIKESNNSRDSEERCKSTSNQYPSPRESSSSSSGLRSRTSSLSKRHERMIIEKSPSKFLPDTVQHIPLQSQNSRLGMSSPSTSLPVIVRVEEKDHKKDIPCCDKCDGKHQTDDCPHYKKNREGHIDGQKNGWKLSGGSSNLPGAFLRHAKIIPQAGDGSCLFHSLSFGLKDGSDAHSLRLEISTFIHTHPHTLICDTPLSDWVKWDSSIKCAEYAKRMKNGSWGGGIEMACASLIKNCNVHVYESVRTGGFKRISAFDHPVRPELKRTIRILYRGGVHYDALLCES